MQSILLSARQEILDRANFLFWNPAFKIDGQLGMDNVPILTAACPFLRYVYHGKIEYFQQAVICREYGLGLCHLAQLPYGVRCIDKPPELSRVLEIGAEVSPVITP